MPAEREGTNRIRAQERASAQTASVLSEQAAELYSLPLEEFTRERNALVKRLRAAGEDEHARTVQGLAKPKLSAWAVNQLARTDADLVRDLLQTTERVEAATDRKDVREATTKRQKLIRRLVDEAAAALNASGHRASTGTLEEVRRTLHAATSENDRALLEQGALTEPIEVSGFGGGLAAEEDATSPAPSLDDRRRERELAKLHDDLERARRVAAERATEAQRARAAAEAADRAERSAAEEISRIEARIKQLG
jgi:hypothetical protein